MQNAGVAVIRATCISNKEWRAICSVYLRLVRSKAGMAWARQVALAKRHSMTGEAIEVGQRARAYRTILTHFSQRYPKIPAIGPSFTASTCIAFDLLSVNLAGGSLQVTVLPIRSTCACVWFASC